MYDNIKRYSEKDVEELLTKELGERYSNYRKIWNNVDYENIPDFPIHIDFEVIDECNQRCIMCPRNAKTHPNVSYSLNTGKVLDYERFKDVIDEGVNKGLLSINLGAFAEPLLNKKVFEMIKYAHDKGVIDSRLITNGLLISSYIDEFFDYGLVNLYVSLDAFRDETYFEIRGKGFNIVKKNILNIIEEKKRRNAILPIIRVSFIDMEINREEKDNFIEFWRDKADHIDIQVYGDFNFPLSGKIDKSEAKKWSCIAPLKRVSVMSNGKILPCCNFFGINIPIGNIYKNSIEEAWNSEKMHEIRSGILHDDLDNCSICQRVG
jgi:radical SAM protein with 4Fe4S-binding SPASM domain